MQEQAPVAENGCKKSPWKLIVLVVCLPVISWFASGYFTNVQGQYKDLKIENDAKVAVLHGRINDLDKEKVDEKTFIACMKGMNDKLDIIYSAVNRLSNLHEKP